MSDIEKSPSNVRLAFRRKVVTMEPGNTLRLRLSALTYGDAAAEAREMAASRGWSLSVQPTDDGIELRRHADEAFGLMHVRRVFKDLAIGQFSDFDVPSTEQQRFRVAVSTYGRRNALALSVAKLDEQRLRVTRLDPDVPRPPRGRPKPERPAPVLDEATQALKAAREAVQQLQEGDHQDFQLPTALHQRLRVSVGNYARSSGARFTVNVLDATMLRVTRLAAGQGGGRRVAQPAAELEVQRQQGERPYPWQALDAPGKWFRIWLTEQWDQRALCSLAAGMKKASKMKGQEVQYSVRYLGHDQPPERAGYAIIRTL